MPPTTKQDIIRWIECDEWMMTILKAARVLDLPDWWICAGFVRSKVWDVLSGFTSRTAMPDVDLIYFDSENRDERQEKVYENRLRLMIPEVPWSVKNEARMHRVNGFPPYTCSVDAISKFPETVTSLGVKLDPLGNLELVAPHGIEDLLKFHVRPTPFFREKPERSQIYKRRIRQKNWVGTWSKVQVTESV